jgi:hypothetical protein
LAFAVCIIPIEASWKATLHDHFCGTVNEEVIRSCKSSSSGVATKPPLIFRLLQTENVEQWSLVGGLSWRMARGSTRTRALANTFGDSIGGAGSADLQCSQLVTARSRRMEGWMLAIFRDYHDALQLRISRDADSQIRMIRYSKDHLLSHLHHTVRLRLHFRFKTFQLVFPLYISYSIYVTKVEGGGHTIDHKQRARSTSQHGQGDCGVESTLGNSLLPE